MTLWKWSTDPATNGSADSTCPWPEGMAPAQVNDSARGNMAAIAKWRDDIHGINVTGGTGTAYTLTSNQVITSNLDGMTIQFIPGTTNTGAVTLSVDGQTAKPIRFAPGVDLPAGALISGSLYQVTYRSAIGVWLLNSFDASIYAIPIGGGIDYWGTTAPSDNFVFAYGQAISRTVYDVCFARLGTAHGSGDGSTTFNLPDKRSRVSVGKDDMGGSASSRITSTYFGNSPAVLGNVGGSQSHTLTAAQLAPHTHGGTTGSMNQNASHMHSVAGGVYGGSSPASVQGGGTYSAPVGATSVTISPTNTDHQHAFTTNTGTGVTGSPHNNLQPMIICNYIIRIK